MVDVVPVDVAEESVRHNLLGIRGARSQSQFGLAGQQLLQNRNRIAGHVNWVERLVCKDSIVNLVFIFSTERRLLQKHLVDKHTESPPINRTAVLLIKENL